MEQAKKLDELKEKEKKMENLPAVKTEQEIEPLSVEEIKSRVNIIQRVMKDVMQNHQHYGIIPGCGDKPTLLKAGAEKLLATFRLSVDVLVDDLSTSQERRYRIVLKLYNPHGGFAGAGIGEASSNEEKFAWRQAVCDEEFDETPENQKRTKWKRGARGEAYQLKQVKTNPADQANTVLKIAKKRAMVDATLTATAASDIFTQDLEEMGASVTLPASKKSAAKKEEAATITQPQANRLWAISKTKLGAYMPEEDAEIVAKSIIAKHGFEHSLDITKDKYGEIVNAIENWKP